MARLNECLMIWKEGDTWAAMGFDGVKSEGHIGTNIITSYPVSKGFKVSEHAIRQNAKVQLEAVLTNISWPSATVRQSFELAFITLVVMATGEFNKSLKDANKYGRVAYDNGGDTVFSDRGEVREMEVSSSKIDLAFEKIKELTQLGTLIHLITIRGIYTNCVIRGYSTNADVSNSYSMPITLDIEELIVVQDNELGIVNYGLIDDDASVIYKDLGGFNEIGGGNA